MCNCVFAYNIYICTALQGGKDLCLMLLMFYYAYRRCGVFKKCLSSFLNNPLVTIHLLYKNA